MSEIEPQDTELNDPGPPLVGGVNPITISSEDMKTYAEIFRGENVDPVQGLAREIAETLGPTYQFDYQSLKDGRAEWFDGVSETKSLSPENRGLSDFDIIQFFSRDPEGNLIKNNALTKFSVPLVGNVEIPLEAFGQGMKREALPSFASLGGASVGARVGAAVPIPHPGVKFISGLLLGGVSAAAAYASGETLADQLLGPKPVMLPGQTSAYAAGETLMGGLAWMAMPYLVSKNVNFGMANYFSNLTAMSGKTPRSVKLAEYGAKALNRMGDAARSRPFQTAILEGAAASGAAAGAGVAEDIYPDNPYARIFAETAGGISSTGVVPLVAYTSGAGSAAVSAVKKARDEGGILPAVGEGLKNLYGKGVDATEAIGKYRTTQSVRKIKTALLSAEVERGKELGVGKIAVNNLPPSERAAMSEAQLEGVRIDALNQFAKEQIDGLIEDLEKPIPELIDEATGKPIKLTSAAKSGSPVLLEFERALDSVGTDLAGKRLSGAIAARRALTNKFKILSNPSNMADYQEAADLAYAVLSKGMETRLTNASERVVQAYEAVRSSKKVRKGFPKTLKSLVPEGQIPSNIQLSDTLYDVAQFNLGAARRTERKLWNSIPNVDIPFDPNEPPAFMSAWDAIIDDIGDTQDLGLKKALKDKFSVFSEYVERQRKNLGYSFDKDGVRIPASDDAQLTTKSLISYRSALLNDIKKFAASANPDENAARIANNLAEALLEDLESVPVALDQKSWRTEYDFARSYSKALNDTFTRAFTGKAARKDQTGDLKAPLELLAKKLLQGGNDPTYLRLKQIQQIGEFAADRKLPKSHKTIGSLRSVTNQIIRNARSAAFDPETGKINPKLLNKYVENNEDVLNMFPDIKRTLMDAKDANVLLDVASQANKDAIKAENAQITFFDAMNPKLVDGRRVGTENPQTAISSALTGKTPLSDLNNLYKYADDVGRDADGKIVDPVKRLKALEGFKSSILEYAQVAAGGSHSGALSGATLYNTMYKPLKNSTTRINLDEWMKSKDLWGDTKEKSDAVAARFRKITTELIRFEAAEASGTADGVLETASPLLDLLATAGGSAAGTKLLRTLGGAGPASIAMAQRGAKQARRVVLEVPAALRMDLISNILENPELLAALLKKPGSAAEKIRAGKRIGDLLKKLGYLSTDLALRPVRQAVPNVIREREQAADLESDINEVLGKKPDPSVLQKLGFITPEKRAEMTRRNAGPYRPPATAPRPAAPAPITGAANPQQRARMQQLFPGDTMMTGIGSL